MERTDVTLATADGPMRTYQAEPEGDTAKGAVIVIPEAFGLNDHIEDVTERFATAGYLGLGLDVFHRSGGGTAPYDDFSKVMPLFEGMTDDTLLVDIDAAVAHLNGLGYESGRVGIVGFCFGGRVTFLAAVRRRLGAAVGFYGGGIVSGHRLGFPALVDEAAALETPWLGLFGDQDQSIPVDDVERLRTELDDAAASVAHEIVRYPGAGHGFHCDQRPSYDKDAAGDAWQRTLAWFDAHLS